jgi:hypothetical protein
LFVSKVFKIGSGFAALIVVLLSPCHAFAQPRLAPNATSTGTMVAAALETVGYHAQSQILTQLSSQMETLSGMIFTVVIFSAVLLMSLYGDYKIAPWVIFGPPLFVFISGIEIASSNNRVQSNGAEWALGAFKDSQGKKDAAVKSTGLAGNANVSFFFQKYNEFVSEAVQEIVKVISNEKLDNQMLFMSRQRILEDLFGYESKDPGWKSLMGYFMVHCSSELSFAALTAKGGIDSTFRNDEQYEMAKENYCKRWDFPDKPFATGPQWRFVYDNDPSFRTRVGVSSPEHFVNLKEKDFRVSCADMWSWIVNLAVGEARAELDKSIARNVPPEDKLENASAAARKSGADVEKAVSQRLNRPGEVERNLLPDPCPGVNKAANDFVSVADQGPGSNSGFNFRNLTKILTNQMIRKELIKGPLQEMFFRHSNYSGFRAAETAPGGIRTDPTTKLSILRRTKTHELSYGKKYEAFSVIMLLPYVQGLILYVLAATFPFFAMLILMPNHAGGFFTWMALWAWAKSWDIGWALIMSIDKVLWELMPKASFYNSTQPDAYTSPINLLEAQFIGDHAYNASLYWLLLATMVSAVPVITGHAVLGTKRVFADLTMQGVSGIVGRYAGSGSSSGGAQTYQAMDNTGNSFTTGERLRVGNFYGNYLNSMSGVVDGAEAVRNQAGQSPVGQAIKSMTGAAEVVGNQLSNIWNKASQEANGNPIEAAKGTAGGVIDTMMNGHGPNETPQQRKKHQEVLDSKGKFDAAANAMEATAKKMLGIELPSSSSGTPKPESNGETTLDKAQDKAVGARDQAQDAILSGANAVKEVGKIVTGNGGKSNEALSKEADSDALTVARNARGKEGISEDRAGAPPKEIRDELDKQQVFGYGMKAAGEVVSAAGVPFFGPTVGGFLTGALSQSWGGQLHRSGMNMQRDRYDSTASLMTNLAGIKYEESYHDPVYLNWKQLQAGDSLRGQWFFYPQPAVKESIAIPTIPLDLQRKREATMNRLWGKLISEPLHTGANLITPKVP